MGQFLIIAGIMMVIYFIIWTTGILLWSFDIALVFILASGVCMIYSGIMLIKKNNIVFFIKNRVLKTATISLIIILTISFAVIECLVIFNALKNDGNVKADFVLIPGAEVVKGEPSRVLLHRLDKALEYIRKDSDAIVIVSGSIGLGDTLSEAEVMEKYLVTNGVDRKRIIKDNKALNSYQSVKCAKSIIDNINSKDNLKLMIITNGYHIFRMKTIAKATGIDAFGISVPIHYSVAPICYTREYFSILKIFCLSYSGLTCSKISFSICMIYLA
ncbi:MAG: YdcF family protein [Bacteroidota bacterium]|nr:YdcF family protein [Bacteroidota bacterium]